MSVVSRLEPKKSEGRRSEGDGGMPFLFLSCESGVGGAFAADTGCV